MLVICDSSSISGDNLIIITNDLLITATRNEIARSMDAHIVTSNRIPSAFHFIRNRITITDNLCIATINDFIPFTGNICIDIRYFLIRIRDGIPVAVRHCRILRGQYRRTGHSTKSQQSGDDGSYGRLT